MLPEALVERYKPFAATDDHAAVGRTDFLEHMFAGVQEYRQLPLRLAALSGGRM
ncbi:hypothetical protein [Akkermansia sp.]|uniref:hypothetical protein n=1 Tax=Akkermansia TaxID=239934 RepID=UPI0025C17A9D|nr:hypothetical protein [Akkermansia sp.]